MRGSMGEHETNNSAEGNYIDLHNNLVSAIWNQGPGCISNCGYYMSQQTRIPVIRFLSSTIGTGKQINTFTPPLVHLIIIITS
jgi:hypothetical protein